MKLGEALALRADLQKRMHQLQALLQENASVQEGDQPAVNPRVLLEEYREIVDQHELLVRRIDRTNLGTRLTRGDEALTLADAVVRRERLAREADMLRDVARRAIPKQSRWTRSEIKQVPAVDVADVLSEADRLSKAHRELDTRMQQRNWEAELVE